MGLGERLRELQLKKLERNFMAARKRKKGAEIQKRLDAIFKLAHDEKMRQSWDLKE